MHQRPGVSEPLLVSFFISGLRADIRQELFYYRPFTLEETFSLARAHEARTEAPSTPSIAKVDSRIADLQSPWILERAAVGYAAWKSSVVKMEKQVLPSFKDKLNQNMMEQTEGDVFKNIDMLSAHKVFDGITHTRMEPVGTAFSQNDDIMHQTENLVDEMPKIKAEMLSVRAYAMPRPPPKPPFDITAHSNSVPIRQSLDFNTRNRHNFMDFFSFSSKRLLVVSGTHWLHFSKLIHRAFDILSLWLRWVVKKKASLIRMMYLSSSRIRAVAAKILATKNSSISVGLFVLSFGYCSTRLDDDGSLNLFIFSGELVIVKYIMDHVYRLSKVGGSVLICSR